MNSQADRIYTPKYFTQKAIACFGGTFIACICFFPGKILSFQWMLFDWIAVAGFFTFASSISKNWSTWQPLTFQKRLWWVAFGLRLGWIFFSYFYFSATNNSPFEYQAADSIGYHGEAQWLSGLIKAGKFDVYLAYIGTNYADMGYPTYLGLLSLAVGDSIVIPRILKAIWGAFTCLLIYRIAKNNFGESVGRIAGILGMLLPNLIYYCGLHVKETEMVFVVALFVYYADKILRAQKVKFVDFIWLALLGGLLFFFRTVLAVCLISSVGIALFFTAQKVTKLSRRIGLLLIGIIGLFLVFSSPLQKVITGYIGQSDENVRRQMLSYSTHNKNTNKLAQYGSKSIFLPMMLVAPFPTLVDTDQINPMMLGGAFFTRNVYAFFVILALISLYRQKIIREHIYLIAGLFSYLFVLGSTGFALSERFHMPAVPFLLIFAAYGISQLNKKNKKYYVPYLLFIAMVVIVWNWFKLTGRG